jgi:hypothetical protein
LAPAVRVPLIIAAVAGLGAVAWFSYSPPAPQSPPVPAAPPTDQAVAQADAMPAPEASLPSPAPAPLPAQPPATPQSVAQWVAAATGANAEARAEAINALADAPKAQAVPVLRTVLSVGDPEVDRQLALSSLQTLALKQGDADGSIRKILREAIYHGDNDSVTQGAQTVLEDIERASTQDAHDAAD